MEDLSTFTARNIYSAARLDSLNFQMSINNKSDSRLQESLDITQTKDYVKVPGGEEPKISKRIMDKIVTQSILDSVYPRGDDNMELYRDDNDDCQQLFTRWASPRKVLFTK